MSLDKFMESVSAREPFMVTWTMKYLIEFNLPERSFSCSYKTKEDAIARAGDAFTTHVCRAQVFEAMNIDSWKKNGYYHLVGTRKDGEQFKEIK